MIMTDDGYVKMSDFWNDLERTKTSNAMYEIGYKNGRTDAIEEFLSRAKERKYHSEITCENAVAIAQLEWLAKELKEQREGEQNDD